MGAIGALAFETTLASTTLVSDYDVYNDDDPSLSPMVSVTIFDILANEYHPSVDNQGFNGAISYSVQPNSSEAITRLEIPNIPSSGLYHLRWIDESNEGVGLNEIVWEGDSLFMTFTNPTYALESGKVLEFEIYNQVEGQVGDLDLAIANTLEVETRHNPVTYSNGESMWVGPTTTLTSTQGYVVPGGTNTPEPSSMLLITFGVLPLLFRRSREKVVK